MNIPEVTVSGKKVIATGSVVCEAGDIIDIHPFVPASPKFKIRIKFANDTEQEKSAISTFPDDGGFVIELKNFSKTFAIGNAQPIHVATYQGRKILIMFVNQAYGVAPAEKRLFSYTFYEGDPVNG